jgi:TM2 domain-containing membrane protein YozV
MEHNQKKLAQLLWSFALPGVAQLLNGSYFKGIMFIVMGLAINVQANYTTVIILSFQGEINQAIEQTNYQWLMFYPCLYTFAMWDGYRDVGGAKAPYSYLPFVFAAYWLTVGVIYSPNLEIFGILLGPMWLPFLFLPLGLGLGLTIKIVLLHYTQKDTESDAY